MPEAKENDLLRAIDPARVREHFPSLGRPDASRAPVFLDNPAGTQVARQTLDAMRDYLLDSNANHGGVFATGRRSDALIDETRAALADFLGAARREEIVFGANMTTLTFGVSRAFGRTLGAGDEIVVTRLDHDANIAPWLALEERGAVIRWIDVHPEDCTLDLGTLEAALGPRTRLVAVGLASNAVGTVNDVGEIARRAHAAGALCFVDAVHAAPHLPIDVQELGCDLLACSAYKFFGPHIGVLYGRHDLLDQLPAYKVRPANDRPPDKFESGTQNHEGIAGTLGALRYFEWLANDVAPQPLSSRRARLRAAMQAIRDSERTLSTALLAGLGSVRGVQLRGIRSPNRLAERVPTVSFTLDGHSPRAVAQHLADRGIQVWDGNYYALAIAERLGVEESGGMVRVGAVHYNTVAEIERCVAAVAELAGS